MEVDAHAPIRPRGTRRLVGLLGTSLLLLSATPAQHPIATDAKAGGKLRLVTGRLLPAALASFGACRSGEYVYVYGGHIGRAHAHSRANVVGAFRRLRLVGGDTWEELPGGPALQGTALAAAADGSLYRVGGMTAHNEPGADDDLHSTASVARFDPQCGTWSEVTPLPEPRSSHDAVVVGDELFVVGGWHLHGSDDGDWLSTNWVADLREQPLAWRPLPPLPEPRRAAALAAVGDELVLLGGIGPEGVLATVRRLDAQRHFWHPVAPLPGMAFGTAAVALDGVLYATVRDGRVCALRSDGSWDIAAQLEVPRFFHRLVAGPETDQLLVLGGAGGGGHTNHIEVVDVQLRCGPAAVIREITIPAPGEVASRQAVLLVGETLWAFGGNRERAGDRFAAAQFADDIWRIDLATHTAVRAASLPSGRQSLAAASLGTTAGQIVLGGLGCASADTSTVTSLTGALRFDSRRRTLQPFAELPAPRTQCQVVQHDGKLWVLGGTDFRPDADGGSSGGDCQDLLVCDPDATAPGFTPAGRLPRPRRSFAAAVLGDQLLLVGGLGEGFAPAGPIDVYDFATGEWRELAAPIAWVSPQAAVLGDRVYVACGGTMRGQRFTEDRSLWSWSAADGWRCVVPELPFAVRHVHMLAWRNRLLFYAAGGEHGRGIILRTLLPDAAVHVLEAAIHR